MADAPNYHSRRCRGLSVDQSTGQLRYEDTVYMSVAQFIGPKPLSENCDSFSIEIVNTGWSGCIGIGLCHRRYPYERQPGWDINSIGYHADNGGIYHEAGRSRFRFGGIEQGEVMECCLDLTNRTVTFLRNGNQVFTSQPLPIPPGGFYPIIGLHSPGEIVRLLELDPWTHETDTVSQTKDVFFHSLFCRDVRVSQTTGIVRYHSTSHSNPVGQFVSKCPLSPECNKFTVEIVSLGQRSGISIGVCHRCYPSNCQPGWLPNSIAYHADDGGLHHGRGESSKGPKATVGDTLSCEFDFSNKTHIFRHNGSMIYRSPAVTIPPGGFHAAVGFHSPGEAVCLIEREPWRSTTDQHSTVEPKFHFSTCNEAFFDSISGTLSYNGGASIPVAQLISKCPLSPQHNSFSIEILNPGKKCCIAIGLCPQHYPVNNQPGWAMDSVGYHADNGGLYIATGHAVTSLSTTTTGEVITCMFNFSNNTATFIIKGKMAHKTVPLTVPSGGFYAAVGLHSKFESVRLCETEPWRDVEVMPSTGSSVTPDRAVPTCCICMDKRVSRFPVPCGHTFCVDCIEEWTTHHKTCPACRLSYSEVKILYF